MACSLIFGTYHNTTFIPLALARTHRRATAAQWAALIARDRGCIHCGRIPQYCQAHHIVHWKDGGLTDLSNLALLCARCHHDLHMGLYTITMDTHGIPHMTPTRAP
ncbi:MAG: HNH endonuclease, partial [Candidatus Nanopelagicales bacterium]|nr:HNH endonuclease [Candidatus Nanopelagicales bacterium]